MGMETEQKHFAELFCWKFPQKPSLGIFLFFLRSAFHTVQPIELLNFSEGSTGSSPSNTIQISMDCITMHGSDDHLAVSVPKYHKPVCFQCNEPFIIHFTFICISEMHLTIYYMSLLHWKKRICLTEHCALFLKALPVHFASCSCSMSSALILLLQIKCFGIQKMMYEDRC